MNCPRSVLLLDPVGVGIEPKKEDQGESHDVHVEKQHDAAVVEAPAKAEAAQRVICAPKRGERYEDHGPFGMDLREARDKKRYSKAAKNQCGPSNERAAAKIENSRKHGALHLCGCGNYTLFEQMRVNRSAMDF